MADVSLTLEPGTFTAFLGPNGSGKSTLLALLAGLHRPGAGQALLGGREVWRLPRAHAARGVAFLPARPHAPADYTAREVVLMGRHPFGRGLLLERPADVRRADAALERADALAYAGRPCLELSSGERQRVLLARVLCQDAPALLLDEPTSAQDPAHALDLFALCARLAREEGRTVAVATHDLNAAARHADRLVVLRDGAVRADGPPAQVLAPGLMAEAFDVEAVLGAAPDDGAPFAVPTRRTPAARPAPRALS